MKYNYQQKWKENKTQKHKYSSLDFRYILRNESGKQ